MNDATEAVTVVWVEPARDDAVRALDEWGHVRGLALHAAGDVIVHGGIKVDVTIADRVEKELDRAKEAISAIDADAAERALARAETILRDHPELPSAAWLRAELHRTWAARWLRVEPKDEARARAAWQEAEALDGGRVPGIGETAFPKRAAVQGTITVRGAAIVRLDGVALAPRSSADGKTVYGFDAPPAEHQIVAYVEGEPAFASWVAVAPGTTPAIEIRLSDGGRCDGASFARVTHEKGEIGSTKGVACDHWVAAVPGVKKGAVFVARCERESCGPLLEWRTELVPGGPSPVPSPRPGWPGWATWTIVGFGAATLGTVALIATGALEARQNETRFVAGGVRSQ